MKLLTLSDLKHFWTNAVQKIPIKISDLQDDVALGTHIADTDIHVTTTDKTKWNNGVSQSYVFRYSGTAITDNSTIAYSTIDNTDNIKSGDKILDVDGKLFEITAVDTTNQTVTVGTALIDLALDANVVHRSGNETIGGDKTFTGKIYSNDYYYGSTAWGLDKTNTWTNTNTFQQNIFYERTNFYHQTSSPCYILKDTELEKGSLVASAQASYPGLWQDKNSAVLGYMRFVEYATGRQTAELRVSNLIKNGALDPTGSEDNCTVLLEFWPSGEKSLIPEQNNDINLGTSTNKWKSFNGLTPSSLSLPTDNIANIIDISGYLTVLDGSQANTYQAPSDGYIGITMSNCTGIQVYITGFWGNQIVRPTAGVLRFFMPICKNMTANILIFGGTVDNARFFPCQGNI